MLHMMLIAQYNPRHPVMSHFTQLVWRSTARVGCASAICPRLMNNNVDFFPFPGVLLRIFFRSASSMYVNMTLPAIMLDSIRA